MFTAAKPAKPLKPAKPPQIDDDGDDLPPAETEEEVVASAAALDADEIAREVERVEGRASEVSDSEGEEDYVQPTGIGGGSPILKLTDFAADVLFLSVVIVTAQE